VQQRTGQDRTGRKDLPTDSDCPKQTDIRDQFARDTYRDRFMYEKAGPLAIPKCDVWRREEEGGGRRKEETNDSFELERSRKRDNDLVRK
jgi:hypothetical protein